MDITATLKPVICHPASLFRQLLLSLMPSPCPSHLPYILYSLKILWVKSFKDFFKNFVPSRMLSKLFLVSVKFLILKDFRLYGIHLDSHL